MSAKGYSAVSTNEPRESADMESRVAPTEERYRDDVDDDAEGEPTPSDRLLPSGAQDDADLPAGREPLQKRATRWMRSRPSRFAAGFRAFRKRCTARGILLTAIIGCLLASTTGLAISTGILASRPRYCWSCTQAIGETRLPWVGNDGRRYARSYIVDLATVYPPLSTDAEASCKYAWAMMGHISCHEKVLNRAWDDGKQNSIFEPRYDLYAESLGYSSCLEDLESTYQLLSSQFTCKDTFDTSEYIGPMTADPYLEAGPVEAVKTLLDRARHAARRPPTDSSRYSYARSIPCAAELYQDWFIVDGKDSGNLHGLDVFLKATNRRVDTDDDDNYYRQFPDDRCDNAYAPYRGWQPRSKKGPGDGETECSWCLVNYFDRKLQSWEDGKVFDPVNGTKVDLPTYLRTIEDAGRRCQTHDWDRIYRKNIWMYQERGLLSDDFEPEGRVDTRRGRGSMVSNPKFDDWLEEAMREVPEMAEVWPDVVFEQE